jgi:hypothetical protein
MHRRRIANWILACAATPEDRHYMLGDLDEEYVVLLDETSRMTATWWYWTQVLRSIPWLLWIPVRRSGWAVTLGVTAAACAAQASVELTTAAVVPAIVDAGTVRSGALTLAVLWGSLVVVSCIASRIRPGAGTLLAVVAVVAMLGRTLHAPFEAVHFSYILLNASAPCAALFGAALAVNVQNPRNTK